MTSPWVDPTPQDDSITGMGLLITTTVGCWVLVALAFPSDLTTRAIFVVLAALLLWTVLGGILRRRESLHPPRQLSPQAPPPELSWNEWLLAAQQSVGWRHRTQKDARRWWAGQPCGPSPARRARRTILTPARAPELSGYRARPDAAGPRAA